MPPCWFWISISVSGFSSGAATRTRVPAEGHCHGKVPWFSWFKMWRAILSDSSALLLCFYHGAGRAWSQTNRLPPPTPLLGVDFGKFQVFGLWPVQWKNGTHFLGSWWNSKWYEVHTPPDWQSCQFLFLSVNPILPLVLAHFHLPFPQPGLHTWLQVHLSLSLACPAVFPDSCEPRFLHNLYKVQPEWALGISTYIKSLL